MAQQTKTDNHNLAAKLKLRRHFLDRYHADGMFSVFDCCQGDGVIWKALAKEYTFSYWGVDTKRGRGRLAVDSVRILGLPGLESDVVDIDTYGSPWKHWMALVLNIDQPMTVFLTEGMLRMGRKPGGGTMPGEIQEAMGINFATLKPAHALLPKVAHVGWRYAIAQADRFGLGVKEMVEALNPGGSARYFGVRLEPEGPGTV